MTALAERAARRLPADVLRLIYFRYCQTYYNNPANRLQMACKFIAPDGRLREVRAKLRVRKRFNDSRCGIYLDGRLLLTLTGPIEQTGLDAVVDSMIGGAPAKHHRMDMIAVCAKTICGDYSYTRPRRDPRAPIDVSGPRAFVSRAVLVWLERSEVSISTQTRRRDLVRGRAAKLGETLPAVHYFP